MKHLKALNRYFKRYRGRLLLGMCFVVLANLFAVLPPVVVRDVLDDVAHRISLLRELRGAEAGIARNAIFSAVLRSGLLLVGLALLRGVFMFFMRQTIIVMSRHIEYDQKSDLYDQYQRLHSGFYKTSFTGDLMNRISEDVARVRMYTGPAIMYSVNLLVLLALCLWGMLRVSPLLTVCVIAPLPVLAGTIYLANRLIYRKSEKIQAQLSDLTTTAQESYSGIRVLKSFVQEENTIRFFENTSEQYRRSAVNLALTEAVYFPAMNGFIGLSMLSTVLVGGYLSVKGIVTPGNIAEFVIYLNLLMFPISSIGWVASMTQRAASSQKRINDFLQISPEISSPAEGRPGPVKGGIDLQQVSFTYPHTGIRALKEVTLHIPPGQKVAILGRTGSGKSTIAQLLLRMYDPTAGQVQVDGTATSQWRLPDLRGGIAYTPQEALLFSDTIRANIRFGRPDATDEEIAAAAGLADLTRDIAGLDKGYDTVIGERGVMLSGGQKQRLVLARALLKDAPVLLLDECLSAVDMRTEQTILQNLREPLADKTVIVITHRIFTAWRFDQIIMLDDGLIAEQGTHDELMALKGRYANLYRHQTEESGNDFRDPGRPAD